MRLYVAGFVTSFVVAVCGVPLWAAFLSGFVACAAVWWFDRRADRAIRAHVDQALAVARPRHPDEDYRLTRDERAAYRQIVAGWIQETEREGS